jgi:phosphoribosylformimino-5-aminoimidazole carboxamide ribotide isomerase
MGFEVIPAIDLRGGRCVRLFQGDYGRETAYEGDPAEVALRWQSLGAGRIHIVDLDGARSGVQANAQAVERILATVSVPVELGGGIRDLVAIERWLRAGLDRVYLGTAAVSSPDLVEAACSLYPGRIAAAADVRDGRIAVRGWEEDAGESAVDFALRMIAAGVRTVSYTNAGRDGTFEGPDYEGARALIAATAQTAAQIILAGGAGSLDHVRQAAGVPGLSGLIIGRALYEGRIDLGEALAVAAAAPR